MNLFVGLFILKLFIFLFYKLDCSYFFFLFHDISGNPLVNASMKQ